MADRARPPALRAPFRPGPPPKLRSTGPAAQPAADKPKREAILDLAKYVNEKIRVKFTGGREVTGILKGYDQLLNLVLDDVDEHLLGNSLSLSLSSHLLILLPILAEPEPHSRTLGLVVLRGPLITIVSPVDGSEEIANPFMAQD